MRKVENSKMYLRRKTTCFFKKKFSTHFYLRLKKRREKKIFFFWYYINGIHTCVYDLNRLAVSGDNRQIANLAKEGPERVAFCV